MHTVHGHGEPVAINTTMHRARGTMSDLPASRSDSNASFCAPTPRCPTSYDPLSRRISGPCATLPGPLLSALAAHERSTHRATTPRLHLTTIALLLPSTGSVKYEIHSST